MKRQIHLPDGTMQSGLRTGVPASARRLAVIGGLAAIGLLAGCAVGPDYARPELPQSKGYSSVPLPAATASGPATGGTAQRFVLERDIQADWWTLFQSPPLNALIAQAFAANPDIESAQAALRVAQENVYAQQGFFFPTVQANYTPSRTKVAGNLGGNSPGIQGNGSVISTVQGTPASEGGKAPFSGPVIYNFHTAQLTVGFAPDVFGANRRQVESLQAQALAQQFRLEATYITLASNIVAAAFQDALLRRQIATTQEMIDASAAAVDLVRRQLKAGQAARLDFALQESALAQARQLLPPLQKQFEQNRDLLRALAGTPQDSAVPAFEFDALHLPQELPLSLPSQLVEQRPDVRAAEEQLRAASAQIGVARAARLPQFSIDATLGGAASQFGQMFWDSGKFFNLALGIAQPLFDGGTLKHRERAANEAMRQAGAQYRSTVITAYQNMADTLHAIHADAEALKAATEVADAARTVLDLTRRQHARGYLDRLALIGAEQTYRQALLNLAQAQTSRFGDTAALFQALGGGWWHRAAQDGIAQSQKESAAR
jgi:NodT family efflux transporter outer membrane factor (OMF) lipoprotein